MTDVTLASKCHDIQLQRPSASLLCFWIPRSECALQSCSTWRSQLSCCGSSSDSHPQMVSAHAPERALEVAESTEGLRW